jgi:hypothetical protein
MMMAGAAAMTETQGLAEIIIRRGMLSCVRCWANYFLGAGVLLSWTTYINEGSLA